MKYFLDTEFSERGPAHPIQLISIGIVREDGEEFYAENFDCDWPNCNEWVKANVWPNLICTSAATRRTLVQIAEDIKRFIGENKPEFWGYYSDYDWVVFCQIFGSMVHLPKKWPMYCRDIKQWADALDNPGLPLEGYVRGELILKGQKHNSLEDARWIRLCWHFLANLQQAHDLALARSLD